MPACAGPVREPMNGSAAARVPALTLSLAAICLAALALLGWTALGFRLPGNDVGYVPVQPIKFSHRLHSTDLQVACLYCHYSATTARYAGMPTVGICMNCHRFVAASSQSVKDEQWSAAREGRDVRRVVSDEVRKLYRAQGLDDALAVDPASVPRPIEWVRVTQFPDFAYFDHRAHARVSIECQLCHGEVQTFEHTRQEKSLSMGWCVECHRDANRHGVNGRSVRASLDCVSCHR
jgi:hypothetical protein